MERLILEELTDTAAPETTGAHWAVHGRTAQVGRVEQLMRDTAEQQRAHVVVVESGAGTGKTRLLLELMTAAARRGFAVVNGAAEQPGLPRAVTLVSQRGGRQEDDRVGVLAARFEAQLANHLRRSPVLVAVDDAQWTDLMLLHALGAVMSKLDKAPVLWLFAVHSDHADSPSGAALRALVRRHRTEWLGPLEPLTGAAVAGIAGDLLDAAPSDDLVALSESVGTRGGRGPGARPAPGRLCDGRGPRGAARVGAARDGDLGGRGRPRCRAAASVRPAGAGQAARALPAGAGGAAGRRRAGSQLRAAGPGRDARRTSRAAAGPVAGGAGRRAGRQRLRRVRVPPRAGVARGARHRARAAALDAAPAGRHDAARPSRRPGRGRRGAPGALRGSR
ncbi:ATP-binding protein [Lentzea guizhouensis]|uniref:ATP-binding protein n=1 Tax=Lentzea guizhouensis TaxID=1586287 RepID=UPI0008FF599A|nr:ATP-binding protein [Lentzea guizhouensis]